MKSLHELPSEILAEILDGKYASYLVIHLFKTGDRLLIHKLCQSITNVTLKDTNWLSTSRFPTCLFRLQNLRTLRINRDNYSILPSPTHIRQFMQQLPSSLTDLSISFEWDTSALLAPFDPITGMPSATSSSLYVDQGCLFDMEAAFPHLTRLQIGSFTSSCGASRLSPLTFVRLPRSLITFDIPCCRWSDIEPQQAADLPRNLETLYLSVPTRSVSHLPPNLTEVNFVEAFDDLDRSSPLFNTLKKSENMTVNFNCIPPSLTRIISNLEKEELLAANNEHWEDILPKRLSELYLVWSLSFEELARLPPSIEHLSASNFSWNDALESSSCSSSFFSSLPLLHTLTITEAIQPHHVRLLPSTLRYLQVKIDGSSLDEGRGICFPTNLIALHLGIEQCTYVDNSWQLPKALTYLRVTNKVEVKAHFIRPEFLLNLPSSITHLELPRLLSKKACDLHLPHRLRRLSLDYFHWHWLLESDLRLPSSLKQLHINGLRIADISEMAPTQDPFRYLPSRLRKLTIEYLSLSDDVYDSGKDSVLLPSSSLSTLTELRRLQLRERFYLDANAIQGLSRHLRFLEIGLRNCTHDNLACFPPLITNGGISWMSDPPTTSDSSQPLFYAEPDRDEEHDPSSTDPLSIRIREARQRSRQYPDPRAIVELWVESYLERLNKK